MCYCWLTIAKLCDISLVIASLQCCSLSLVCVNAMDHRKSFNELLLATTHSKCIRGVVQGVDGETQWQGAMCYIHEINIHRDFVP